MDRYFDKDVIYRGDRLYDLIDGVVEVVDVREDVIICARAGRSTSSTPVLNQYAYTGVKARARVRTLYWHRPIIALPRKDAALWAAQSKLANEMLTRFGDFVTSAAVISHETYDPIADSAEAALERGLMTASECKELLAWLRDRAFVDYEEHDEYEPESAQLEDTEKAVG